jgi:hypothetical protein
MPNKLVSPDVVAKDLLDAIKSAAKGDIKIERAIVYELQTSLGGFPRNEVERKRYIRTGSVK